MPTIVENPISPKEAYTLLSQCTYEFVEYRIEDDDPVVDFLAVFNNGQGLSGNIMLWFCLALEQFSEISGLVPLQADDEPRSEGDLSFEDVLAIEQKCSCVGFSIAVHDETAGNKEREVYEGSLEELLQDIGED